MVRGSANARITAGSNSADVTGKLSQTDALVLRGSWAVGDKITLSGLAKNDLVYTVVANDLTVSGDGSGGNGEAAHISSENVGGPVTVSEIPGPGPSEYRYTGPMRHSIIIT